MKPTSLVTLAALAAVLGAPARAADAPPPPPPAAEAASGEAAPTLGDRVRSEPVVKRTVIDDELVHIEELRVRGQLKRITVDSKGGAPGYEILVGDSSRDISPAPNTSRGTTGKRVWNVFRF